MLGLIDDVSTIVGNSFTVDGQIVALLGWHRAELGGSEYQKRFHGHITGDAPWIDINEEVRLQHVLLEAIRSGKVTAAHDCAEGGVAVALAEMCLGKGLGATLNWPFERHAADIFGEAQSRVLVTIPADHFDELEAQCRETNVPLVRLGTTGGTQLTMWNGCSVDVDQISSAYENALPSIMAI
jgi:phosphoribosylformylglycinamidine synthase